MTATSAGTNILDHDPRLHTRFECIIRTTCQPPSSWAKDPWPAIIRNISCGGLCLTLQRRFEPGSGLAIELPAQEGSRCTVLARVAHVQAYQGGGWIMGVKFISELSDEEIYQTLNLSTLNSAALEKVAVHPAIVTRSGVLFAARYDGPQGVRRLLWFVKQLDHPGVWPIAADTRLTFRFERGTLKMQALACSRLGPYGLLKCRLTRPPSTEVLRHLEKSSGLGEAPNS